jgi:hypothetical protein
MTTMRRLPLNFSAALKSPMAAKTALAKPAFPFGVSPSSFEASLSFWSARKPISG